MNRRNFMKIVGGTLAGVAFVPKAKPQLTVAMLQKVKKEIDVQRECNLRDYPAEFILRDEYDLFTGKKI